MSERERSSRSVEWGENETRERATAEVKKTKKVGKTEALVGSLSSGAEQLLLLSF